MHIDRKLVDIDEGYDNEGYIWYQVIYKIEDIVYYIWIRSDFIEYRHQKQEMVFLYINTSVDKIAYSIC